MIVLLASCARLDNITEEVWVATKQLILTFWPLHVGRTGRDKFVSTNVIKRDVTRGVNRREANGKTPSSRTPWSGGEHRRIPPCPNGGNTPSKTSARHSGRSGRAAPTGVRAGPREDCRLSWWSRLRHLQRKTSCKCWTGTLRRYVL